MPPYTFRIGNGNHSNIFETILDAFDRDAAWVEMTRTCGDLVGGIARQMKQNSEWDLELLDATKNPVFRIRLVAETFAADSPSVAASQP